MKIATFSDSHGVCPNLKIEESDILLICGDIIPLKMQRNIPQSFSWFKKKFIPWCEKQPVENIFMVGGNHDFFMLGQEEIKNLIINTKIKVLYNESYIYYDNDGVNWSIFGSPNCHIFGNWAFMYSDSANMEQYKKMPDDLDILITHDAAYEHSDQCLGFMDEYSRELHRGNKPLQEIVESKSPKLHLFGHLHTCDHNLVKYGETNTACVSLLNENYDFVYPVTYLEIKKDVFNRAICRVLGTE